MISIVIKYSRVIFPAIFLFSSILSVIYVFHLFFKKRGKLNLVIFVLFPNALLFYFIDDIIEYFNNSPVVVSTIIIWTFLLGVFWMKFTWVALSSAEQSFKERQRFKHAKEEPIIEENKYYSVPEGDFRQCVKNVLEKKKLADIELFFITGEEVNCGFNEKDSLIFTEKCKELDLDELAAVVGHEIVHLTKNEGFFGKIFKNIFYTISTVIFLIAYFMSAYEYIAYTYQDNQGILPIFIITSILFVLLDLGVWSRYIGQIEEIKADRKACNIVGTKDGLLKFLKKMNKQQNEEFNKLPLFKKIFVNYFSAGDYPSMEYRLKLIEEYNRWSIIDYFRHFFTMFKWFFTGRGWCGHH